MLAGLLAEYREQLSADFRRLYHCNLTDCLAGEVAPLWEVAAWAAHLPPDSATARAVDPAHAHTYDLELLRRIEFRLAQRVQGKKAELFKFPWDVTEGAWKGDSFEWDDLADALGGDPRLKAVMGMAA